MKKTRNQLVLREDDYQTLISYIKQDTTAFDAENVEGLLSELRRARLVSKEEFPEDVVRLNSRVKIKEENKDKVMEVTLVTPDKADIRERKISIMAPIGTALIGFRKGQRIKWQVPAGNKTFTIMDVVQS